MRLTGSQTKTSSFNQPDGSWRPPLLADESCDRAVIAALREDGYDVYAVSEVMTRSVDTDVLQQAAAERRVLLTEDTDFGWLVFVTRADSAGVVLMRFPAPTRRALAESTRRTVHEYGGTLIGAFTVIQPGLVRLSRTSSL